MDIKQLKKLAGIQLDEGSNPSHVNNVIKNHQNSLARLQAFCAAMPIGEWVATSDIVAGMQEILGHQAGDMRMVQRMLITYRDDFGIKTQGTTTDRMSQRTKQIIL